MIAAILASSRNLQPSDPPPNTVSGRDSTSQTPEVGTVSLAYTSVKPEEHSVERERTNADAGSSLVSPLHILADAVETERLASLNILDSTANSAQPEEPLLSESDNAWLSRQSTERLIKYFSMSVDVHRSDIKPLIICLYQDLALCLRRTGKS